MTRRGLSTAFLVIVIVLELGVWAPSAHAGGGGCYAPLTNRPANTIVMKKFSCFIPTVAGIDVGEEVTWVNRSREEHNVASANGLWGSGVLHRGGSTTYQFMEEGTFPYYCQFHLGMVGTVVVGDGVGDARLGYKRTPVRDTFFDPGRDPKKKEPKKGSQEKEEEADQAGAGSKEGELSDSERTAAINDESPLAIEWLLVLLAAIILPAGVLVVGIVRRRLGSSTSADR